jgi:hypothetical protein
MREILVKAGVRNLLRRKLSPETFRRTSYWWWEGKFYLPRRAASLVVRRNPVVYGEPSDLLEGLRGVNVFAPTAMCRVMTRYGSDKGNSWHNYTTVYSNLFEKLRNREIRLFELGLCRVDPQESGRGVGHPGASLRGWRELFPRAMVFGADIDRNVLFNEDRIQTYYCDQLDSQAIRDLWAQPALQSEMDIIIEDGLHTFPASISFLEGSLERVRVGGTYVVEDISRKDLPMWKKQLPLYASQFPNFDFVLAELPIALNDYDNNLVIIQRRS